MSAEREIALAVKGMDEQILEGQFEYLAAWPDKDLIKPPSQWVSGEHLTGEVVIHTLNEIFGPDRWGYDILEWPELVSLQGGKSGYYHSKIVLWVRFEDGSVIERKAPGLCAIRPKAGSTVEEVDFNSVRMAYQGSITDGIKGAASTLGHRLGLGLNDDLLKRIMLRDRVRGNGPRSVAQDMDDLGQGPPQEGGQRSTSEAQGTAGGNGQGGGKHWTDDSSALSRFWGWAIGKDSAHGQLGLSKAQVYDALTGQGEQRIKSLKQFRGSLVEAHGKVQNWMEVHRETQETLGF